MRVVNDAPGKAREYRNRFFVSVGEVAPELGRYCVADFGAYTYEVGIFVYTPWSGIVFLVETGNTLTVVPDMKYAYIEEQDI